MTVTMKLDVAMPREFEAMHVTVLTPFGNVNGEVIATSPNRHVITGSGTPDAATVKLTSAEHWPASLPTVMSSGTEVNTGASPSVRTFTLKLHVAMPIEFEAMHVT